MIHSHTCQDCGAVLEIGDFDCGVAEDHADGRCDRCAGLRDSGDETIDIGGEG